MSESDRRAARLMSTTIRDSRSGLVGKVIGYVTWEMGQPSSLVVQPPARPDGTVPPTCYVPEPLADAIPQANETGIVQ